MKHGIDVSSYQGDIDWLRVNVDFAILRAGFGGSDMGIDAKFERNYSGCEENEIPKGCYWFSYAMTTEEAEEEAKAFMNAVKGKKFEYPLFYDVEERCQMKLGRKRLSDIIRKALEILTSEGYCAGIYMSADYLSTVVDEDIIGKYPVWVAEYGRELTYKGKYGIWQYGIAGSPQFNTDHSKTVQGIDGECDLDRCYIDYPEKIKALGLNGFKRDGTEKGSLTETAYEVLSGSWGKGQERRNKLIGAGYSSERVHQKTDAVINKEVAAEVIQGKWGNGEERRKRLKAAGYDYEAIQSLVNKMI